MEVYYSSRFLRQLKKLPKALQDEVIEKIELFKDIQNHKQLKVHSLTGRFASYHSFSVNYAHRVVFDYLAKDEVVLLKVGDHDIYDKV